jgi:hypothetical protein
MSFAWCIAISLMVHLAAITAPGWNLPSIVERDPPPIEARLAPQTKAMTNIVPVQKNLQRRPGKKSVKVSPLVSDVISGPSATNSVTEQNTSNENTATTAYPIAEPSKEVNVAKTLPPAPPWPRQGRVRYVVTYGEGGFVVGETTIEWHVDGEHYSIRSVAVPRGIAAIVGKTRTQESAGEVTVEGLRPREFRDKREGRNPETASFDWTSNEIVFSDGRGSARLVPGAQDMVSAFFQLGWLAPQGNIEMAMATANRFSRRIFEWVGEEDVTLASGRLKTLHLRTRSEDDSTEVWLAVTHGGLPIKIRHIDRKGDAFEQTADLLELN